MLKINRILSVFALITTISCTDLTFYRETGVQPEFTGENAEQTVSLRTKQYQDNVVKLTLTSQYGITSAELDLLLRSSRPAEKRLSADLTIDESLLREYETGAGIETGTLKLLPSAFYRFKVGTYMNLQKGALQSDLYGIEVTARNNVGQSLASGRYLLPIVGTSTSQELSENVVFIDLTVPEPYTDPDGVRLYKGKEMFTVFYLNTSMFDPRLANDMVLTIEGSTSVTQIGIGNIVNLRTASVGYDDNTSKVSVVPSGDLRYVLEHYAERVAPVQESGRKVCVCIEGGGKGIGFCNFTDEQIDDFVASVKRMVDTYSLDGINLWDRNTGYGKEGLPEMNTTSYPKLVQALRGALGAKKLITVVDYKEPTAYFDDVQKTKIAVGDLIDYAWHGYNDPSEPLQVIDPWSDADYLSAKYKGTKIAGLEHEQYGCIHWSPRIDGYGFETAAKPWIYNNKQNAIFVFYDIQSNLQQGGSDNSYQYPGTLFQDAYDKKYSQDLKRLKNDKDTGQTSKQYGKWLKDW